MAEEKPARKRRPRREADEASGREGRSKRESERVSREDEKASNNEGETAAKPKRTRRSGLSGARLAQRARQELSDMTGLEAEGVTSLERSDDGAWRVTVELLELSRIPATDDVLGSYQAEFDQDGELIGYRRLRRYARSQSGEEQTSASG